MPSVLLLGSNAPQALESSYAHAFGELDWEVRFWDPEAALARVARGAKLGRTFARFVTVEPWLRKANLELLEVAHKMKPSLVLLIATGGVQSGTLAQLQVLLPQMPVICVFPDGPHNLGAERVHGFPFCQRVTASSPAWVEAFAKLGAPNATYLPFAADPHLHQPATASEAATFPAHDVGFIGTWRPEREEVLEGLADFDLCLWGSDYWKNRPRKGSPLPKRWGGRPLVGQEFAHACARTKIMLNILDRATWPGPNMRVFEQAACRAFSLTTRSPAITDLFREGETIECFESIEEARDKITFYLKNDAARERIAQAGYELVMHGHTYFDRTRQILAWI